MAEMNRMDAFGPFVVITAVNTGFALMNVLLKKVLELGLNPLVFITYRLSISSIFLAPIAYFFERSFRPKLTIEILFYLFCSAIVGTSLTQYLFLVGIQYTSATFACAFVNLVPVFTFIMAVPFGLEKVSLKTNSGRAKIIGTLVCLAGTMTLTLYKGMPLFSHSHTHPAAAAVHETMKLSSIKRSGRWSVGCVALIFGSILWSTWFLVQSKISSRYPCQCTSTAIISFFGSIQSAILCVATSGFKPSIWVLKGKLEIITTLYGGIVGSGLCFVGISWGVKKRGPVFTAAFSPLIQIMAAIVDIPLLHEQLHLGSLLGSVIVIIGLYVLLWGKNKEMKNVPAKTDQETAAAAKDEPQPQLIAIAVHGNLRGP